MAAATPEGMVIGLGQDRPPAHREDASWPYGAEHNFGISIADAVVTVVASLVYRGGKPIRVASGEVTIEADLDWVAFKLAPSATPVADAAEFVRWPAADGDPGDKDGFVYRGLHQFRFADGKATWTYSPRWGGELGMMGYAT